MLLAQWFPTLVSGAHLGSSDMHMGSQWNAEILYRNLIIRSEGLIDILYIQTEVFKATSKLLPFTECVVKRCDYVYRDTDITGRC